MANVIKLDSAGGLSGSLTHLVDGTSYLIAGDNISIVSQSNGSVRISATSGSTPANSSTSAAKASNSTSTSGNTLVDPDLQFTGVSGSVWAVTWNVMMTYGTNGQPNDFSVFGPPSATINWSVGTIVENATPTRANTNLTNGTFLNVFSSVNRQGLLVITAFVAMSASQGTVGLEYGNGTGVATAHAGSSMFARRLDQ